MQKYLLFLQSNRLPGLGPKNGISFSSLRVSKAFVLVLSLSKENSYLLASRRIRITKAHLSTGRTAVTKREVHTNFDEWCFPYIRNYVRRREISNFSWPVHIPEYLILERTRIASRAVILVFLTNMRFS